MRILLRIALVVLVLFGAALAGLAFYLPSLVRSPAVRQRIEAAARDATGREFSYADLSVGLLPPRLVVAQPVVAGATRDAPPFAEAESVGLQVALVPLLARTVVVDSLVVEGATVRLVRTRDGIELPRPPARGPAAGAPAPPPEEAAPAPAGFGLAVQDLRLRDATLLLEDRSVTPAVTWEIRDVEATARAESLERPIDFTVSARLGSGGDVRAQGSATLDAVVDVKARLEGVALEPVAPYVQGSKLAGRLSGSVEARGPAAALERLAADVVLEQAAVELPDLRLKGRVTGRADLAGPELAGTFELDATGAELDYGGGAFRKPPGTPATARGRIVPQSGGGVGVDDLRVKVRNLDAQGSLRSGRRLRAQLTAPAFDLAGWGEVLPALADYAPAGSLALDDFRATTAPLELGGGIRVERVRLTPPGSQPVELRGALRARGDGLETDDFEVVAAGQSLRVSGSVSGLDRQPAFRLRVSGEGLDTKSLLNAYTSMRDQLEGPLGVDATLAGPLGGSRPPAEAVSGVARIDLGKGRIRGVSLLRTTFERLGTFGQAALLAGQLSGSRSVQRFYEDEFEWIRGSLDIGQGVARTQDLQLRYRNYQVDLRGGVGLLDRRLDLTGKITIFEEVDAVLAGAGGAPPTKRVIPLARVTGTVSSPRVDLSPEAVASFVASYTIASRAGKLQRKIDEELGAGAGDVVIDALEGILGGGQRRR